MSNVPTVAILKSYNLWMRNRPMLLEKYKYSFPSPVGVWENIVGPVCPICNGYKTFEASDGQWVYCVCSLLSWLEAHKDDCVPYETPVPKKYLKDLKPFHNEVSGLKGEEDLRELLAYIEKWIEKPDRWIWIEGQRGTGKTHILMAIKTRIPQITFYIGSERFSSECFKALNYNQGDQPALEELIMRLSTVPILLFDDWGLEHRSQFVLDTLAAIINNRYRFPFEFPTVMTSNLNLGKLALGNITEARIASRMSDSQICSFFELSQADYRLPSTIIR